MAKYKVISGIMQGRVFNGHPVTIDNELRIWNDDSSGQSFPDINCVRIWYKQVNHVINGEYKFKEYYKAYGSMQWIKISEEEGDNNTITHFIELRYKDTSIVKDGYIIA